MRFIEIVGGLLQPLSIEESLVVDRIRGNGAPLPKHDLDERAAHLAGNLVRRGILTRVKVGGKTHLIVNELQEL